MAHSAELLPSLCQLSSFGPKPNGNRHAQFGLVVAGPTRRFLVREAAAARLGLPPHSVGMTLQTTLLGSVSSYLLQGDRTLPVRVLVDPHAQQQIEMLPVRSASAAAVALRDVATIDFEPGILEMHREDLRQLVAVSARLSGVDMGRGVRAIQTKLANSVKIPPEASIEYGGLYQQQQESFRNLTLVLVMATVLVFTVLLFEFRTLLEPLAIIIGALLALVVAAAAEAARQSAAAQVDLVEAGTRPEEIAKGEALVDAAEAGLASAQLAIEFCTIRSPIAGRVTQLFARAGMFAERAIVLATVTDLSSLFAKVRIPSDHQADLVQITAGVKPDDLVVTEGGYGLPDGFPVVVKP